MASPESPDSREFRQMRHDVDDVYRLLDTTKDTLEETRKTIGTIWDVQRRHGNRLEEIQQSLDLQVGRLDRMEDSQRTQGERLDGVDGRLGRMQETQQAQGEQLEEILTLLRGRSG